LQCIGNVLIREFANIFGRDCIDSADKILFDDLRFL